MKTYIVILASGERFEVEGQNLTYNENCLVIANKEGKYGCIIPSTAFVFEKGVVKEPADRNNEYIRIFRSIEMNARHIEKILTPDNVALILKQLHVIKELSIQTLKELGFEQ